MSFFILINRNKIKILIINSTFNSFIIFKLPYKSITNLFWPLKFSMTMHQSILKAPFIINSIFISIISNAFVPSIFPFPKISSLASFKNHYTFFIIIKIINLIYTLKILYGLCQAISINRAIINRFNLSNIRILHNNGSI